MTRFGAFSLLSLLFLAPPLGGQDVPVREHVLDNGLRLLMVSRPGDSSISAGWIARVGSVNERPGITGIAHLFEHMMFKGTRTLGTRDIEEDLAIMRQLDEVKAQLEVEAARLLEKQLLGEIDDVNDPDNRSPRHQELLERFKELLAKQHELIVKDEFDKIYSAAGATGMNAGTTHDFTIYFINLPANKLELWCWMEADRLLHPVFREFYSERDVVREERRLRVESTPTGIYDEQFEALFWGSSPYSWPVIGWPSDLDRITRAEALAFYDVYYAPNNLTLCLVGGFDVEAAMRLVEKYFGRLQRGPRDPDAVRTREMPQVAEKRMMAHAETTPQARIRYHTVPNGHKDEPNLILLESILNGRTGRLYKSLVLESKVASAARAAQRSRKYEGFFEVSGVASQDRSPEDVEKSIYEVLAKLQAEPVGARELEKVKNQVMAEKFRSLRANQRLLFELLVRDAYRSWKTIDTEPEKLQAVTAEDVQRVATTYFRPENRTVLLYYRKESAAADPAVASLTPEEQQQLSQLRSLVASLNEPERLEEILSRIDGQLGSAPDEKKTFLETVKTVIADRLDELRADDGDKGESR